jgi:glycosyltransferase involved in cell wall biosynthesis
LRNPGNHGDREATYDYAYALNVHASDFFSWSISHRKQDHSSPGSRNTLTMDTLHQTTVDDRSVARPESPLRIQMLCFDLRGGGTARQAIALSCTLAAHGLDVRMATARFRGLAAQATVAGVSVDRVLWAPDRRGLRRLAKFPYITDLSMYLWRRRRTFDVVHCHMASFELIPSVLIAQRSGLPVVVKIACSGPEGDVQRLRSGEGGVLGPIAALLLGRVSAIAAPSRHIERELGEQGFANRYYIPNGVDVGQFRPGCESERVEARRRLGLPLDRMVVGFLGRLHRQKAVDVLIRAWAASALAAAGAVLCLAGQGREEISLRRIAEAVGPARDSIKFVGLVEPSQFLRALDAYVLPSRFEGMPNALLEAMASGLACVGTRIGGTEDAIEQGISGLLVPPDSVIPLATALDQLLSTEFRARLGQAARRRVEAEFSLDRVASQYQDLYRLVTSSRTRPDWSEHMHIEPPQLPQKTL